MLSLAGGLALAACDRAVPAGHAIAVIRGRHVASVPAPTRNVERPRIAPRTDIAAIPTITANPLGPNPQLAKPAFRSPPLPPELVGDGDLAPLPPLPPASAFAQANQH